MTTISKSVLKASRNVTILGILIAVLGIVAIAYPNTAGNITAVVIGTIMLIGGALRLAVAGSSVSWKNLAIGVFYGLLLAAAGIWVIANPDMGLDALTLLMASYFVIDGATQMYYSFKLRPVGGGSYLLINGLISIALGVLIFTKFPESSYYAIGIYLGIKLLVDGIALAYTAGKIAKRAKRTDKSIEDLKAAFAKEYKAFVAEQEKYKEEKNARKESYQGTQTVEA